jgi:hypothetical protein
VVRVLSQKQNSVDCIPEFCSEISVAVLECTCSLGDMDKWLEFCLKSRILLIVYRKSVKKSVLQF